MDADVILFLLLVVVILIFVTIFGVLMYSGLFDFPTVRTGEPSINYGCTFAYQFIRGPYSSNDVGAAFTSATSIAPKAPSIGIFYDDPQRVPEHELRCAIGCLINREEVVTAKADTSEVVDAEPENIIIRPLAEEREVEMLKKKSFRFCQLPRVDLAVVTEFPYTTPFSIWLAPNKVYPRLCDYISAKSLCAYPMIEHYANNRIHYIAPLSKQDDFFVPECHETPDDQQSSSDNQEADSSVEKAVELDNEDDETPTAAAPVQSFEEVRVSQKMMGDESESVLRRRNLPHADQQEIGETPMTLLDTETAEASAKRKESSQSSASSSFEEIGVDELK